MPSSNNIFLGLRIIDTDPRFAAEFESLLKIAYFGEKPVSSRFIKGLDREWSATPPRGLAYWKMLSEIISQEPVREVDKIMMAMLRRTRRGNRSGAGSRLYFTYLVFTARLIQ